MTIQLLPNPATLLQTIEFAPLEITDQNGKTNNDFSQWLLRFVQSYNDTIIQLNSQNTAIINKINEIIVVVNAL
jgi:hypothetical protein